MSLGGPVATLTSGFERVAGPLPTAKRPCLDQGVLPAWTPVSRHSGSDADTDESAAPAAAAQPGDEDGDDGDDDGGRALPPPPPSSSSSSLSAVSSAASSQSCGGGTTAALAVTLTPPASCAASAAMEDIADSGGGKMEDEDEDEDGDVAQRMDLSADEDDETAARPGGLVVRPFVAAEPAVTAACCGGHASPAAEVVFAEPRPSHGVPRLGDDSSAVDAAAARARVRKWTRSVIAVPFFVLTACV